MFPPYFVAGALFSGFAMVITLAVPLRAVFKLEDFITLRHFNVMGKILLASGLVVTYGYLIEGFMIWYSADEFHRHMLINRALGSYAPAFWIMLVCNALVIHLLWFRRVRSHLRALFVIAIIVNIGMWLERYVIVITSPHQDFMPSAWDTAFATGWDWMMLFGSLGLFLFLMALFIRFLPAISIYEMRELVKEKGSER